LGYYQNRFGYKPEDFPVAWALDRNTLAIPLHNRMTPEDYAYVVDALKAF
jgi:dTDP-4-amino-4,6-dideoxygalactose transaminase